MKSTGMVRKVDELGRIVLPIELRRTLDIHVKNEVEIYVEDDKIVLMKHSPEKKCMVTGEISEKNQAFANGQLVLSKEGAKELVSELKAHMNDA